MFLEVVLSADQSRLEGLCRLVAAAPLTADWVKSSGLGLIFGFLLIAFQPLKDFAVLDGEMPHNEFITKVLECFVIEGEFTFKQSKGYAPFVAGASTSRLARYSKKSIGPTAMSVYPQQAYVTHY